MVDGLSHELQVCLSLFEVDLVSGDEDLVEAGVDNLATELLELVKQLEEVLFHQLVNQAVEQGIVKFGLGRRRDPTVQVGHKFISVGVSWLSISFILSITRPLLN